MRLHRLPPVGLLGLLLAAGAAAGADPTRPAAPSPLRLLPAEADVLVHVRQPRQLVERALTLDLTGRLLQLPAVKERLDATGPRRLRQLLAHFEKQLGAKYPDLIDAVAGGGVAFAGKIGGPGAPALLVVQGTDERRVEAFLARALDILESELKRNESKDRLTRVTVEGVPAFRIGDLLVARLGAALAASNDREALARAVRLHAGRDKKSLADHPAVIEAGKLLPGRTLASAWVNMKPIHASPEGKALYASPRDNFPLTIAFGGVLDVLGRTPFVCAGLTLDDDALAVTVRAPRGRDGGRPDAVLHVNPADRPGSRPLLEPKGILYSSSFYLDLARLWADRSRILPKAQVKGFEDANKGSALAFGGIRLDAVLASTSPYHRVVVANPGKSPYRKQPAARLPAFAVVTELTDADRFGRAVETGLRLGALVATGPFKMKLAEEKHAGHTIVAYRFDEQAVVKEDLENVRFNFTPCFARIGDQFIACSTTDLCRDLIDLVVAEKKAPRAGRAEAVRDRFYGPGLAKLLAENEDQLITQAILDQAVRPDEAKRQALDLIALVESLGPFTLSALYGPKQFRYDLRLRLSKHPAEDRP